MGILSLDKAVLLGGNPEEVLSAAGTTLLGLDSKEALDRLNKYGPNFIPRDDRVPVLEILIDQVKSPLIYVLLAAAAITIAMRHYTDTWVILAVVVLNGIIGFVQEYRASSAMLALQSLRSATSRVKRDGIVRVIDSSELVPGDIVVIQSGDRIDADCRVITCADLRVDESLLTGESVPVEKSCGRLVDAKAIVSEQANILFAGTLVIEGRAEALVIATGIDTELGKIAQQIKAESRVETPLQHSIKKLSHYVAVATLGLSGLVAAIGIVRGLPVLEILLGAIALAVSAIPEGLPVVVTITLAVGVRNMARANALIRKLPAVETLGSTEVICTDKTGTLTLNHMTVNTVVFGPWKVERKAATISDVTIQMLSGENPTAKTESARRALDKILRASVLCNSSSVVVQNGQIVERSGNPTEIALLEMALNLAPELYSVMINKQVVAEIPFSSERKFMAVVVPKDGSDATGLELLAKGSPEVLVNMCDTELTEDGSTTIDKDRWLSLANQLAEGGQRVLALAQSDWLSPDGLNPEGIRGLTLLGLVGLIDPPRPDAAEAVEGAKNAGVNVVMVTGDHAATARAIAIETRIIEAEDKLPPVEQDPRVLTGRELQSLSDEVLMDRLEDVKVYARVVPTDKHRIVRLFKERGKVVAVTGDGVNDAPALKSAHIGIAMGKSGTEVARQASDMVLLDDSFATIIKAIRQGRFVFENIKKVSFFLISSGVGEILAVLSALLAGWPLPYTPVQILWINLATNGLQDVALAFEPGEEHLMRRKPRGLKEGIFDRLVVQHMLTIMVLFAVGTLAMFKWSGGEAKLAEARTVAMTTMVMFQMWHVFNCRSLERSIFNVPLLANRFLLFSVVAAFCAQLAVLYWSPMQKVFGTKALTLEQWAVILLVTGSVVPIMELSKLVGRRSRKR
jgi:Ca2+-transporting ATPase